MKKFILTLLLLTAGTLFSTEPVRIYKGWSESYHDCIFSYKDGRLYKGWSESYHDCLFTCKEGRIYKGWSESYHDCTVTIKGKLPEAVILWICYYCCRGDFL